jgi:hypothetical protein
MSCKIFDVSSTLDRTCQILWLRLAISHVIRWHNRTERKAKFNICQSFYNHSTTVFHRGSDRRVHFVVGFTTTCSYTDAISAYHH